MHIQAALNIIAGKRLTAASRLYFDFQGSVDRTTGPLELEFEGGLTVHLTGASDGERLSIQMAPWEDPLAEPLTPENAAYVRECGKWTKHDISSELPIGGYLESVRRLVNESGSDAGLELDFSGSLFSFVVYCDEDYLMAGDDPRLQEWGFTAVTRQPL